MLFDRPMLLKHTDAFISAAKEKHVNEVYLISHALLETGSVKSELANGVEIDGKIYNFYGVGALDSDLLKLVQNTQKTRLGYSESYQSGADFIHQHFLSHDDQNTLYSMRWNLKSR